MRNFSTQLTQEQAFFATSQTRMVTGLQTNDQLLDVSRSFLMTCYRNVTETAARVCLIARRLAYQYKTRAASNICNSYTKKPAYAKTPLGFCSWVRGQAPQHPRGLHLTATKNKFLRHSGAGIWSGVVLVDGVKCSASAKTGTHFVKSGLYIFYGWKAALRAGCLARCFSLRSKTASPLPNPPKIGLIR